MPTPQICFSPCPNDYFIFRDIVRGKSCGGMTFEMCDIASLNRRVVAGSPWFAKVSAATALRVLDQYQILPIGAAFSGEHGPRIVTALGPVTSRQEDFQRQGVAVAGLGSTAAVVFRHLFPDVSRLVAIPFDQISEKVATGEPGYGIVIHEIQQMLDRYPLRVLGDLGQMWRARYGAALPLGVLVARRDLDHDLVSDFVEAVSQSMVTSRAQATQVACESVRFSAEDDVEACARHIDSFVSEETFAMSEEGMRAIDVFSRRLDGTGIKNTMIWNGVHP